MFELTDLLEPPVAFHPSIARRWDIPVALMVAHAYKAQKAAEKEGKDHFCLKVQEWEHTTTLTPRQQRYARAKMIEAGFWSETTEGFPAEIRYRIDIEKMTEAINTPDVTNCQIRCNKMLDQSDVTKCNNRCNNLSDQGKTPDLTFCNIRSDKMLDQQKTDEIDEKTAKNSEIDCEIENFENFEEKNGLYIASYNTNNNINTVSINIEDSNINNNNILLLKRKNIKKEKEKEKEKEKDFQVEEIYNNLKSPEIQSFFDSIREDWNRWLDYKKSLKKTYKHIASICEAITRLFNQVGGDIDLAKDSISYSISRGWEGIFISKNSNNHGNTGFTTSGQRYTIVDRNAPEFRGVDLQALA